MNRPIVTAPPQTRGWLAYYAFVSLAIIGLLIAAVVGIATDNAQNKEQDRLLACFDTYASQSASTSVQVREASEKVTSAQAKEARTAVIWTDLLVKGLAFKAGDTSPAARRIVFRFAAATTDLRKSQAALVVAQTNLAKVRKANPVPGAPSTFCDVS